MEFYTIVRNAVFEASVGLEETVAILSEDLTNCVDKEEFMNNLADALVQCDIETQFTKFEEKERPLFIELVKAIASNKIVFDTILKERFDIDSCAAIGLIADKKQVQTLYNRIRTKLYYKQNKFNLMKEENEGYARLLTLFYLMNESNYQKSIDAAIKIIGTYNVDPNRVLDIILETFEYVSKLLNGTTYILAIKHFFDSPEKILQLILLKMEFYTNSKEELNSIPQNLYRMIAMLIKEQVIEVDDIYPHLIPSDIKILDFHKKLLEEAKVEAKRYSFAIIGGGEEKRQETEFEKMSEEDKHFLLVDNQKLIICFHLIKIGDWNNAILLSRKLPEFYCFSNKNIALASCETLGNLIEPVYRDYCGLPSEIKKKMRPLRKYPYLPEQITSVSQVHSDLLPRLQALGPYASQSTLFLTKLIRLFKGILCEKNEHQQDHIAQESPLYYALLETINDCILPSVSLAEPNSCLARELWTLLKNFNYNIRYKLYFNLKDDGLNQHLLRKRGSVLLKAKHHMKRLSKDTIKTTGRNLGKLCYCTPVMALGYVLLQIQSYDNLIGPLIDSFKYLPSYSLDVIVWCIIETLADPSKQRQSNDGMAIAPWLTSLSTFSANFILKYKVEFTGFLQFIANQLKAGKSLDLILLADLIQKMTGIEANQDITDEKIGALMGGEILRTEGAYFSQGKNTRKSAARLKDALIDSNLTMPLCILMAQLRDFLFFSQQDESHLKLVGKLYDQCQETFVQYGVFLSQNLSIADYSNFLPPLESLMTEHKLNPDAAFYLARPMIMYKIRSKFNHLKANPSEYRHNVPAKRPAIAISEMHAPPLPAREQPPLPDLPPGLDDDITPESKGEQPETTEVTAMDASQVSPVSADKMDVGETNDDAEQPSSAAAAAETVEETTAKKTEEPATEQPQPKPQTPVKVDDSALFIQAANSVLDPLVEALESTIRTNYGQFSPKLFVLFWALSMSDLEVPRLCYEREINKLNASLTSSHDDDPKRRKENEKIVNIMSKLASEAKDQFAFCKLMHSYLEFEKNSIFLETVGSSTELTHQFIQHCLFARSILTAYDAIYSSRFILTLHELKIDGFSTLICYDRLLCDITYMMCSCTEKEANHYGRFLNNLLKTISYWHSNEEIYKQRCGSYPGFVFKVNSINDPKDPKSNLDYENFRHVCHKWHYRLTKALVFSLESNSYVQIRNALIVLISMIDYFPVISSFGRAIEKRIEGVRSEEKDNRHDLYALATAYFGRLESKKSSFVLENDFHKAENSRTSSAHPTTTTNSSSASSTTAATNSNPPPPSNGHGGYNSSSTNDTSNYHSSSNQHYEMSSSALQRISRTTDVSDYRSKSSRSGDRDRATSSSRPSSKTRNSSPSHGSRERHSSTSSRKRFRKS